MNTSYVQLPAQFADSTFQLQSHNFYGLLVALSIRSSSIALQGLMGVCVCGGGGGGCGRAEPGSTLEELPVHHSFVDCFISIFKLNITWAEELQQHHCLAGDSLFSISNGGCYYFFLLLLSSMFIWEYFLCLFPGYIQY